MGNRNGKKKLFYGWIIVIAGFIIMSTGMGIAFNCSSLFIEPVSKELAFSRSEVNATVTIRYMCQMLIAFFSGKLFVKYKMKRLMQISAIALPLSYFCYSFSQTLITYYIITLIVSISAVLLTILPLSLIISNWFHDKRGLALGLTFMGSGAGGMVFNFLAGLWIKLYGWRITYQILSFLIFLTVIPCVFFLIHIHPRDIGLLPLGEVNDDNSKMSNIEVEGFLLSQAVKTSSFWGILVCAVSISMCINTLLFNISPHLTDIGYSTRFSANIVAMSMGSLAIFKVILGQLYDKLGLRIATTISCFATLFGLVGLIFANIYIVFPIIILCVGLGCSSNTMANPIITQKLFGLRDYSSIYGILTSVSALGGVIAPIINGYIFDVTGSYNLAFMVMIGVASIAILIYQFVFSKGLKIVKIK